MHTIARWGNRVLSTSRLGSCSLVTELDLSLFTSGMVLSGRYWYTKDLMTLDSYRTHIKPPIPHQGMAVSCPLAYERWRQELAPHPDRAYVDYIIQGLKSGFRIGFNPNQRLRSTTNNLCIQDSSIVSDYLSREVALDRTWICP